MDWVPQESAEENPDSAALKRTILERFSNWKFALSAVQPEASDETGSFGDEPRPEVTISDTEMKELLQLSNRLLNESLQQEMNGRPAEDLPRLRALAEVRILHESFIPCVSLPIY